MDPTSFKHFGDFYYSSDIIVSLPKPIRMVRVQKFADAYLFLCVDVSLKERMKQGKREQAASYSTSTGTDRLSVSVCRYVVQYT